MCVFSKRERQKTTSILFASRVHAKERLAAALRSLSRYLVSLAVVSLNRRRRCRIRSSEVSDSIDEDEVEQFI